VSVLTEAEAAEVMWLEANAVQVELFCPACEREWSSWSLAGDIETPCCPSCGECEGVAL
jgi:hypothetical protein